jgi:hypothetical protein
VDINFYFYQSLYLLLIVFSAQSFFVQKTHRKGGPKKELNSFNLIGADHIFIFQLQKKSKR